MEAPSLVLNSLIQRMPRERDLIVLLDNTDDSTLLNFAMDIRRIIWNSTGKKD